jgi:hypothetical protein
MVRLAPGQTLLPECSFLSRTPRRSLDAREARIDLAACLAAPKTVLFGGPKVPQSATAKKDFPDSFATGIWADARPGIIKCVERARWSRPERNGCGGCFGSSVVRTAHHASCPRGHRHRSTAVQHQEPVNDLLRSGLDVELIIAFHQSRSRLGTHHGPCGPEIHFAQVDGQFL